MPTSASNVSSTSRSDLDLVLAIQDAGSLVKASQKLNLGTSMVTKRLALLEQQLGVKLFFRTTRKVTPTAEGELFSDHAKQLLAKFVALEDALGEQATEPSGNIKIISTFGFGRLWLGPAIALWSAKYPNVRIDLRLTETLPDLAAQGIDAAIWLWSPSRVDQAKWSAKLLAKNERVLVAAPSYIDKHGKPATLTDLAHHQCLAVYESADQGSKWQLTHQTEGVHHIKINGALSSNSGELVRDWCVQGKGIMLRSLWDVSKLLAQGQLVQVLPQYAMKDANIQWLAPFRPHTPLRVSLLRDYLSETFKGDPWLAKTQLKAAAPQTKPQSRK